MLARIHPRLEGDLVWVKENYLNGVYEGGFEEGDVVPRLFGDG